MTTATHRILLVEDNELSRELASSFLGEAGFSCTLAENGAQAVELLKHADFDIILMDVEMPVLNGIDATRAIRSGLGITTPVVAMTAHDSERERQKCMEAGMNDCITKPFGQEEICSLIYCQLQLADKAKNEARSVLRHSVSTIGNVVDLTYLESIAKGREKFLLSMIDIFLEQNTGDMVTLGKAVAESDYKTIRLLAHKIKVSVNFVGLEKHIQSHLVEMEDLGLANARPARIRELFEVVDAVCTKAYDELRTIRVKRKANAHE